MSKSLLNLLIILTVLLLLLVYKESKASDEMKEVIKVAAKSENIPYTLLAGVCAVESNFRHLAVNTNEPNGYNSHGLCQIQLRTAQMMGFRGKASELYNPSVNAKYAARYIRYQYKRYNDWWNAVAAYNAGRLILTRNGDIINKDYVKKVRVQVEKIKNEISTEKESDGVERIKSIIKKEKKSCLCSSK